MKTRIGSAALSLFVACIGCSDRAGSTAPTRFLPLTGSATTYVFNAPLDYPVRGFTERSSFVLYDSGGFYLWYDSSDKPLQGTYTRADGGITFYFNEPNTAPDAFGTLKGDLLEIRFSELAQHADFENAAYKRAE